MLTKAEVTKIVMAAARKYDDTTSDFNSLGEAVPEFILYGKLSLGGKATHRFSMETTNEGDIDTWFSKRAWYEANKEKLLAEYRAQKQAEAEILEREKTIAHERHIEYLKEAYRRGEGFIQINPIIGGIWCYDGKDYSYDWIRSL